MNRRALPAAALWLTITACVASATDWPQLARDAGRSGTTSDEIRPPFSRKWYRLFADEGIQSGVQPIVANGHVYVPTLHGKLHAINAETGKDSWGYDGGAPMLHTAAADAKHVYVACGRSLHAVNAGDGTWAWAFHTSVTLWNAPALHQNVVLFGDRTGTLHALDAATGNARWSSPIGSPILSSPAIDAARNRAYVAAEDMRVYAFDLATGKVLWGSLKLPGCSFRGYHPVIAPDGSIMVTVTPVAGGDAIQQVLLDMVKEVFGSFSSWRIKSEDEKKRIRAENFDLMAKPQTYQKQLDYLRQRLTDEPALQTFFVLDPDGGRQKFVTPIVYAESMNGPGSPPIVTQDGKVIVKYNALLRSRYEHYSPFLNVGHLDTATGHITPIMDQSRTYGWHNSLLLVHDEQSQLVAGGNVLSNTHQDNVNAMDLKTLQGYSKPWANNVHEVQPGVAVSLWAYILHDKPLPQGWEWLPRGTAVYGGGSVIDTPVTISGDSFYFLPTHEINAGVALIAYKMDPNGKSDQKLKPDDIKKETLSDEDWPRIQQLKWEWDTLAMPRLNHLLPDIRDKPPGTRENPLTDQARAAVAKITGEELDSYILTPAPHRPLTRSPHQAKLNTAVAELILTQWRPLLFPCGKHPAEAYRLFADPTETLYTLALAYPHLSADLQVRVREHAARVLEQKTRDLKTGTVRSGYDEPPDRLLKIATEPLRSETARVYPLWLWSNVTGDWDRLTSDWPRIRDLIEPKPTKDELDLGNARISGLIAACRIAKHLDDTRALQHLLPQARQALRDRLQFELAHTEGGLMTRQNLRTFLGRWRNLNPDLAAIFGRYCAPIHQRLMHVYIDHHRPAWHVAWNVELLWRNECPFSFPDMSRDIFAARALILGEEPDRLSASLDIPWCRGDEYFIQKLAMLLNGTR